MKINPKIYFLILSLLLVLVIFSVFFRPAKLENSMNLELSKEIEIINKENIFFGHRSVGENIIQGVKEISSKGAVPNLDILKINNISHIPERYFLDANIGSNGDPKSKIDDFNKIVNQLAQKKLTIAMMKLCYADIKENTDINDIVKYYTVVIDSLHKKYPGLMIIHLTVPLTSKRTLLMSIKDFIKRRSNSSILDNVVRNKYNQLLFLKYPADQIFDLAKIESTYPDGKREEFIYQGKAYNSLISGYSLDGGHLNEKGKHLIAEKFLSFLSEKTHQKTSASIN